MKIVLSQPGKCYRRKGKVVIKMGNGEKMEYDSRVIKRVRSPCMERLKEMPRYVEALKQAEEVMKDKWRMRLYEREFARCGGMYKFYKFWSVEDYVVGRVVLGMGDEAVE